MVVLGEGALRVTVTLVPDLPHHDGLVLLIERVPHMNEEKPLVLLLRVLLPQY